MRSISEVNQLLVIVVALGGAAFFVAALIMLCVHANICCSGLGYMCCIRIENVSEWMAIILVLTSCVLMIYKPRNAACFNGKRYIVDDLYICVLSVAAIVFAVFSMLHSVGGTRIAMAMKYLSDLNIGWIGQVLTGIAAILALSFYYRQVVKMNNDDRWNFYEKFLEGENHLARAQCINYFKEKIWIDSGWQVVADQKLQKNISMNAFAEKNRLARFITRGDGGELYLDITGVSQIDIDDHDALISYFRDRGIYLSPLSKADVMQLRGSDDFPSAETSLATKQLTHNTLCALLTKLEFLAGMVANDARYRKLFKMLTITSNADIFVAALPWILYRRQHEKPTYAAKLQNNLKYYSRMSFWFLGCKKYDQSNS